MKRFALGVLAISCSLRAQPAAYSAEEALLVPPAYNRTLWKVKYVRPQSIPFPPGNGFTVQRELLGRTLFFDPRLSGSSRISCATCHNPGFSWSDALPRGIGQGMQVLDRKTPTILNIAWAELLFWDGRAESLEEPPAVIVTMDRT